MPLRPPRGYAGVAGSGGLDGLLADPGIQALGADATRLTLCLAVWAMIMGAVTAEVFSQYGTQAISDRRPTSPKSWNWRSSSSPAGRLVGDHTGIRRKAPPWLTRRRTISPPHPRPAGPG